MTFANKNTFIERQYLAVNDSKLYCTAEEPEKTASNAWRDVTLVIAVSLFIVIVVRGEASTVVQISQYLTKLTLKGTICFQFFYASHIKD